MPRSQSTNWFGRLGQISVVLICLGLSATFAHYAKHGRHGLDARDRLVERATLIEFEIRSLEATSAKLSHEAALLRAEPPHPDIVEETARDVLGYVRPGETLFRVQ